MSTLRSILPLRGLPESEVAVRGGGADKADGELHG